MQGMQQGQQRSSGGWGCYGKNQQQVAMLYYERIMEAQAAHISASSAPYVVLILSCAQYHSKGAEKHRGLLFVRGARRRGPHAPGRSFNIVAHEAGDLLRNRGAGVAARSRMVLPEGRADVGDCMRGGTQWCCCRCPTRGGEQSRMKCSTSLLHA